MEELSLVVSEFLLVEELEQESTAEELLQVVSETPVAELLQVASETLEGERLQESTVE